MEKQPKEKKPFMMPMWVAVLFHVVIWAALLGLVGYAIWHPETVAVVFPDFKWSKINYAGILKAILFIWVTLTIFRVIKRGMLKWIQHHDKIDKGIYYSFVTLLGYVGWVIAGWGGLSLLGVNLESLAVIVGALSVGIGFGLQHVVNNFISGLLILFERPIRKGDWIRVSGHEGIVKNIHIRSTELETFDKTSVLIPNADVLSRELENITKGNSLGRVIIPVGVSYDSDLRLVEKILLDVAKKEEGLAESPAPFVLLTDFADSSVQFELRGILKDVTKGLAVKSRLRFAIWDEFQKHHIEIPYPQRVVHVKDEK
ncbi:MAG: mechanosensitive ion channel [Alphaproteobacteria bacterium]|nr:mechanosensitive ion channel [Alphaproteobacteria bacterium]